jgi:hypothetical protein
MRTTLKARELYSIEDARYLLGGISRMIGATEASPCIASVLRALIGVDQRAPWPSLSSGHEHGIQHELAAKRRTRGPTDDLAREQGHNNRQMQPALPGAKVGNISDPGLIRPRHRELSLQQVRDQGTRR